MTSEAKTSGELFILYYFQKKWVLQNFRRISQVSLGFFFFFFLLAGLAVDFLHRAVSESCLFFCKAKKLSGSDLFPCFYKLNDVGV